ncbi:hypothetical protein ACJ2_28910 [Pantoea sp. QMID2]|nr:hypothetical protein ACJ3_32510 [Pantoea sp. QMID3]GME59508.1 hypothetical protein ACJ2_28910 [Pantoea sp. QMID2]
MRPHHFRWRKGVAAFAILAGQGQQRHLRIIFRAGMGVASAVGNAPGGIAKKGDIYGADFHG